MNQARSKAKFKVRFHLGKGDFFMMWRIENTRTKEVKFVNPKECHLFMTDCFLRNQKAAAQKIHKGANKSVCAWIECSMVQVVESNKYTNDPEDEQITYNPRVQPNWVHNGKNADSKTFDLLVTEGNKVFYITD